MKIKPFAPDLVSTNGGSVRFFDSSKIKVVDIDRRYFYFLYALFSEATFSWFATYFATQRVFQGFLNVSSGAPSSITVSSVNALLSTGVMLTVCGPVMHQQAFDSPLATSDLREVRECCPRTTALLEKSLLFFIGILMISCWYVVADGLSGNKINRSAAVFALFPAAGMGRGFYVYVRVETIKNFAILVRIMRGDRPRNKKSEIKTALTSLTGALAVSGFSYFILFPAFQALGVLLEIENNKVYDLFSKSISFFAMGIVLFITLMAESGKVYLFFDEVQPEGAPQAELSAKGYLLFGLCLVVLWSQVFSTYAGYAQALCETAQAVWGFDERAWSLRMGVSPIALSGTWNYKNFVINPARDFFRAQCQNVGVVRRSVYAGIRPATP